MNANVRKSVNWIIICVVIITIAASMARLIETDFGKVDVRTIGTFHTEGAGGGHAPDIIKACGEPNVLPSSTNPTTPVHGQHDRRAPRHADGVPPPRPGDRRGRRVRRVADPARDDRRRGHPARPRRVLDDVVRLAGDGPRRRGDHPHLADRAQDEAAARRARPDDRAAHDNFRVKRYIAKYTINPAITHGIGHVVGSVEPGKLADLVLWKPAFFGVKPSLILKGGMIAAAAMGDPNASIPTPQPVHYRPMFGAFGERAGDVGHVRVEGGARRIRRSRSSGSRKPLVAVKDTRTIGKRDMKHNDATAADRRRSGDLRGARRRRAADLRAGARAADGAALFPVLTTMLIDPANAVDAARRVPTRTLVAAVRAAAEEPAAHARSPAARRSASFLERGTVLRGGECLRADDGRVVRVVAADEELHGGALRRRRRARPLRLPPRQPARAGAGGRAAGCASRPTTCWPACCAGWARR